MYELRISANTVEELLEKAATLASLGTKAASAPDVPLPEPRALAPLDEPAPTKRTRKAAEPVAEALSEPVRPVEPETTPEPAPEPEAAPEAPQATDEGIPAHMLDDSAPATVEEAQAELAPEPEVEPDDAFPPDFKNFIEMVETATEWPQIPDAMREFYNSDTFKAMTPDAQNRVRANTWDICQERALPVPLTNEGGIEIRTEKGVPILEPKLKGLPDPADNMTAFRLFLEACEDKDAIVGTKQVLERSAQWNAEKTTQAMRDGLTRAVEARLGTL